MEEKISYIAVSLLKKISCKERVLLLDCLGSSRSPFSLKRKDIEEIVGRQLRGDPIPTEWSEETHRIASLLDGELFDLVHYWDERYPPQLREIYDPPFLLYVRGTLPSAEKPYIAAVGTRHPSASARQAAFRLGAEISIAGVPLVSGLARGIDSAVHWGVVETGGITLAVEATGVDRVYPASHRGLARKIIEAGGALISEYPPGTEVRRFRFPERNRLISGLSRAVVVVQAPEKSGALITADYALEQGRELLVHADGLNGSSGKGGRGLFDDGARVIRSGKELFEEEKNDGLELVDEVGEDPMRALEEEIEGRLIRFDGKKYRRVG